MTQYAIIIIMLVVFQSIISLEVNVGGGWYGKVFLQKKIKKKWSAEEKSLVYLSSFLVWTLYICNSRSQRRPESKSRESSLETV